MPHPAPSKIIESAYGIPEPATREHLARCPSCRRVLLEVEVLRALYLESSPDVPDALSQKVKLRVIQGLLAGMQERKDSRPPSTLVPKLLLACVAALLITGGYFLFKKYHAGGILDPGLTLLQSRLDNVDKPLADGLPEVTPEVELKPRQQASVDRAAKQLLIKHSRRKKHRSRPLGGLAKTLRKKFLEAGAVPSPQPALMGTAEAAAPVPPEATATPTATAPAPAPPKTSNQDFSPAQAKESQ